jgi:phosphonoacetate hydrolase
MPRLPLSMALLLVVGSATFTPGANAQAPAGPARDEPLIRGNQRVVIAMIDGFGTDYLEASDMPVLKGLMARGFSKTVSGVMPSVTNVNNASIACGAWPEEHGITGNSYYDEARGELDYMESADYLRAPTVFQRAARRGIKSALLTAKKKTAALLSAGTEITITAESPTPEAVSRYGQAPPIYSREINYWLWEAAVDLLKSRPDIRVLYIHTTDYPMHTWPPTALESKEHLAKLDALIGKAVAAAPDAAFLFTADHGLNAKSRCWDLAKACKKRGLELRFAFSAERDKYIKHHRNLGGAAWVWLKSPDDARRATAMLQGLEGVESVLSRQDAARRFHLMPERIGELIVLGDKDTVFGDLESDFEALPPTLRTHGSLHETEIPVIIFNASGTLPPPDRIRYNFDITRSLFRDGK